MNKTNDIYEWIELYLMGQLEKEDLRDFEAKIKANKDFAEDIEMIELEMYEQDLLSLERKELFEKRLQTDPYLSSKLNVHTLTFEAVHYFDNQGCCKDQSILHPSVSPSNTTLIVVKNRIVGFIIVTWIHCICLIKHALRKRRH